MGKLNLEAKPPLILKVAHFVKKSIVEGIMETSSKADIIKDLRTIPGVGKAVAEDLYNLGYVSVADLKNREPHMMYERLCMKAGKHVDRCMLYTFRCAVYYASHKKHDPKKLKWWNWKDKPEKVK